MIDGQTCDLSFDVWMLGQPLVEGRVRKSKLACARLIMGLVTAVNSSFVKQASQFHPTRLISVFHASNILMINVRQVHAKFLNQNEGQPVSAIHVVNASNNSSWSKNGCDGSLSLNSAFD
jgi:hypothetical protein